MNCVCSRIIIILFLASSFFFIFWSKVGFAVINNCKNLLFLRKIKLWKVFCLFFEWNSSSLLPALKNLERLISLWPWKSCGIYRLCFGRNKEAQVLKLSLGWPQDQDYSFNFYYFTYLYLVGIVGELVNLGWRTQFST